MDPHSNDPVQPIYELKYSLMVYQKGFIDVVEYGGSRYLLVKCRNGCEL